MSGKADLVTLVTATVGDSANRLDFFLRELRSFTKLEYRHIVCDDRTPFPEMVERQRDVCNQHGVEHMVNPGAPGVGHCLDYLMFQVSTPWAFFLEDGVRPSRDWLESIDSFLHKIAGRTFGGRRIGMFGVSHIQDWVLAMGGALNLPVMDHFFGRPGTEMDFYGPWNDGYWCFSRMRDRIVSRSIGGDDEKEGWQREVADLADLAKRSTNIKDWSAHKSEQMMTKFGIWSRWPENARAKVCCYPGGKIVVNKEAYVKVGGFHPKCTFYEGYLGIRMAENDFLPLFLESPPFLHRPSQCFKDVTNLKINEISPRDHEDTDKVFHENFGFEHARAVQDYAYPRIGIHIIKKALEDLAEIRNGPSKGAEK